MYLVLMPTNVKYLQSVIKNNLNFLYLLPTNPNGDGIGRLTSIWIRNLFRYLNNFGNIEDSLLKYFQKIKITENSESGGF